MQKQPENITRNDQIWVIYDDQMRCMEKDLLENVDKNLDCIIERKTAKATKKNRVKAAGKTSCCSIAKNQLIGGRPTYSCDKGAASAMTAGYVGIAVFMLLIAAVIVGYFLAHKKAQNAADLAAIAGVQAQLIGKAGCQESAAVARSNAAELTACEPHGEGIEVRVAVQVPLRPWGLPPHIVATSRGWPADS